MKRVDWILSVSPFNPQKSQIPEEDNSDGTTKVKLAPETYTETNVAIYNDPPGVVDVNGVFSFLGLDPTTPPTFGGTMTTVVTDVSPTPGVAPYIYSATVTVTHTYRNRPYSLSMTTLRTSDE